jgi:hypothetical protein|tara:strand:+ start:181 stop:657 length:477 start_codon:yes stop_codon:yes gene_type:complete
VSRLVVESEIEFANQFLKQAEYSTEKEDITEHWDVSGVCFGMGSQHFKFDVKERRRINRSDVEAQDRYIWVEGTNVHGEMGWIRGKADYIVFEQKHAWLIVGRKELFDFVVSKLKSNNFKEGKDLYCIYQRKNRLDKITLVDLADVKTRLNCKTLYKL